MPTPLVCIHGAPHAGKSTIAKYLVREHGFTLHKIATPMKNMLRSLGLTEEHIEGSLKDVPTPLLGGKTPRWGMLTLGKDWRDMIHPDLWLIAWENTRPDGPLVVDDIRYPNEVPFLHERGAKFLKIERPNNKVKAVGHDAEKKTLPVDAVITNKGTIQDLETIALMCLRGLSVLR